MSEDILKEHYKKLSEDKEFSAYMIGDGMFSTIYQNDENEVPRQIISVWSGYLRKIESCIENDPNIGTNEDLKEIIHEVIVGMKAYMGQQGYKKPLRRISDTEFLKQLPKSSLSEYKEYFEKYLFGGFS